MAYENLKTCRNCRKLFNAVYNKKICPVCEESLEIDLAKVKEYLWQNKGASIPEVSEKCDVSVSQLRIWLREERIQLSDESGIELSCELCGKRILSGRFCNICKNQSRNEMLHVANSMRKSNVIEIHTDSTSRMRFANKN